MKLLLLLSSLIGLSIASREMIVEDFDPDKPIDQCKSDGQFLLHPNNRCQYIRCTYGPEPWADPVTGEFKFFGVARNCPWGTSVPHSFYGHVGYGHYPKGIHVYDGEPLDETRLCSNRVDRHDYHACSVHDHHYYDAHDNYGYDRGYGNRAYYQGHRNHGYRGYYNHHDGY